jgi:hypothetical protein
MSFESLTDENIFDLIAVQKIVDNPQAKYKEQDGHKKRIIL